MYFTAFFRSAPAKTDPIAVIAPTFILQPTTTVSERAIYNRLVIDWFALLNQKINFDHNRFCSVLSFHHRAKHYNIESYLFDCSNGVTHIYTIAVSYSHLQRSSSRCGTGRRSIIPNRKRLTKRFVISPFKPGGCFPELRMLFTRRLFAIATSSSGRTRSF